MLGSAGQLGPRGTHPQHLTDEGGWRERGGAARRTRGRERESKRQLCLQRPAGRPWTRRRRGNPHSLSLSVSPRRQADRARRGGERKQGEGGYRTQVDEGIDVCLSLPLLGTWLPSVGAGLRHAGASCARVPPRLPPPLPGLAAGSSRGARGSEELDTGLDWPTHVATRRRTLRPHCLPLPLPLRIDARSPHASAATTHVRHSDRLNGELRKGLASRGDEGWGGRERGARRRRLLALLLLAPGATDCRRPGR